MAYDDDLPRPYEIGWRPKPHTTSSAFRHGYQAGMSAARAEAAKRTCATCRHWTGPQFETCREKTGCGWRAYEGCTAHEPKEGK